VSGLRAGWLMSLAVLAGSLWWRTLARPDTTHASAAPYPQVPLSRPAEADVPAEPSGPPVSGPDIERLRARRLLMPVDGYDLRNLRDGFRESRGDHVHQAIDLMAPRGTLVHAADDGTVRKLLTSGRGGLSVYEFDLEGRYCYYYAHLDHYAPFLVEGKPVRKGDVLGYVGSTGNAPENAPHLHFAIFKLEDGQRWWRGRPVNPYDIWASALE
jgi:murein DD-endopeptidase MepM/ murein hydrolase activator NlpD